MTPLRLKLPSVRGGRPKKGEKPSQKIDEVSNDNRADAKAASVFGTNRQYVADANQKCGTFCHIVSQASKSL